MENFSLIKKGVEVAPLLEELEGNSGLWDSIPYRRVTPGSAHREVHDIWLRYNYYDPENLMGSLSAMADSREMICYPAWKTLNLIRATVFDFMRYMEATRLGRVMVTCLEPGKQIYPHADGPAIYHPYFDRFHLCLQSDDASTFTGENEVVTMRPGEVWWVNNTKEHSVVNNGKVNRLHLIVDVRL